MIGSFISSQFGLYGQGGNKHKYRQYFINRDRCAFLYMEGTDSFPIASNIIINRIATSHFADLS
jgi:hypothetical protein